MAVNGIGNSLRIGGLASGLDTDSIIKQLMDAEKIPLTKLNQKKTILEWKRDNYRDMTNVLRGFKDEFFDVLKPNSNMRSISNYKKFTTETSNSAIATATASSEAVATTHTISGSQLAEAANVSSGVGVSGPLEGSGATATDFSGGNTKFNITLNGVTKTIVLATQDYGDTNTLINDAASGLQKLVDDAFGAGKITVADSGGGVLSFQAPNSKMTLSNASSNNALGALNINNNSSNRINTLETLQNLASKFSTPLTFNGNTLDFTINNIDFSIDKSTTLSDFMSQINSSAAGVDIRYSEVSDKFTITAKQKGAGNNITITNTGGNFFTGGSGINDGTYSNGKDANFILDGKALTRNDNTFTIDGVTYTLKDKSGVSASITVGQDNDGIFNNIKAFVDKYNEVIGKINDELSEKYNRNYLPLTDEQKKDMSEDDIKLWEGKAKSGLLKNDNILQKAVNDMRKAIYDSINGVSGSLSEIGISTSSNYLDKGKLVIDETKLKNAISSNPDKVQNLFAKSSSSNPSYSPNLTAAERSTRYNEEGIVNRLYDILQDNIRITRDSNGKKGALIEKAGMIGDISEFKNIVDEEINKQKDAIAALQDRLYRKENQYYRTFAALEKSISQMNSQGSWLSQQLGSKG